MRGTATTLINARRLVVIVVLLFVVYAVIGVCMIGSSIMVSLQ